MPSLESSSRGAKGERGGAEGVMEGESGVSVLELSGGGGIDDPLRDWARSLASIAFAASMRRLSTSTTLEDT